MLALNGKRVDLLQLAAELTAASVAHQALGTVGEGAAVLLHTYDANGAVVDLPAGAAAVVAAHTPPPLPVNYAGLSEFQTSITTTDIAPLVLARLPLGLQTGYTALVDVTGIDRANGVMRSLLFRSVFKRLNGGGLAVGAKTDLAANIDTGAAAVTSGVAGWTITPSISGTDAIITVVGAAARTVDWACFVSLRRFVPTGLLV